MKTQLWLVVMAFVLGACAHKVRVLDTPAVSMTQYHLAEGKTLVQTGEVKHERCFDAMKDKGTIGMIDETTKEAQAKFAVDFVLNARFYATASCMGIEGTGAKMQEVAARKKK
jgi:hypothetical protein